MGSQIHTNTLVDDVVDQIRQKILAGEMQPGDFLPTRRQLASLYGVGLSTVHEAIQALSAVGMLDSRPGKGTWVREDALDGLIHPETVRTRLGDLNIAGVYEARSVMEVTLTRMAAQRSTPVDIGRIRGALERMEACLENNEGFVAADLDFHLAVAKASKNELLEQFYYLSRRLIAEAIHEMVHRPGVKQDSILYQRAILGAIEDHDPEAAEQAARSHMGYVDGLLKHW